MRGLLRAGLVVLCLLLMVCQAAGAFHVSTISVDPSGSLVPCDPVNISFSISFPVTSGETFPADNELIMETDLEDPQWSWSLNLDGLEKTGDTRGGRGFSLGGSELSYPSYVKESVKITLSGDVPTVEQTQNKTLIKIYQTDSENKVIEGSITTLQKLVINTCCINLRCGSSSILYTAKADLQAFRVHIDEKTATGVNTTLAEEKYSLAEQRITSASSRPSTQFSIALTEYNEGRTAITDGERLLDKAWAEQEIAMAQVPIQNTGSVIDWLNGDKSASERPELQPIIAKREKAIAFIASANDELAAGNYSAARGSAGIAFTLGNESYAGALEYAQQESRPTPPTPLPAWCCIFAMGIAGIVIYRKKRRG